MIVRHVKYALKSQKEQNVYIGRSVYGHYGEILRKGSPLANPFKQANWKDDTERKQTIEQYRHWLWQQLKAGNEKVWTALRALRPDSILLCSCYPKLCHGHVIIQAWEWASKQGLIDPVYTNHTSSATLENRARANAKALADARLDEEILETCPHDHEICQPHTDLMAQTLPPGKKQGVGPPRKPRGIVYIQPDTRYNEVDDIAADLEELYATTAA